MIKKLLLEMINFLLEDMIFLKKKKKDNSLTQKLNVHQPKPSDMKSFHKSMRKVCFHCPPNA